MKRQVARFYRRLRRALRPEALPAREHARNGDVARDSGDWELAKAHYLKALAGDSSLEPIWVQLGHAHKIASDFQASEEAYRRALQLDAQNGDTWLQLGHVLRLQGRLVEARTCYEKSALLSPDNTDALREAASLGADSTLLSQAPISANRRASLVSYSSRLIGRGRLLIDVTAAADLGDSPVAEVCDALSRHRDHPVDLVIWREGGWRTLAGGPYDVATACVAIVVIGPWSIYRPDHAQALRHYSLHRGVPVIGGLMDLTSLLEPELFPDAAADAAMHYLQFLGAISSGVLTLLSVDKEEARAIVRRFTPNVGDVSGSFGSEAPSQEAAEHIEIVGIEGSAEFQVARRALGLLTASDAARFRFTSPTDGTATIRSIGGVLLSSDVHTRMYGRRMIGRGRPIALGARRGLSAFAHQAALRMPVLDVRLAASHLKAFAAICAEPFTPEVPAFPRGTNGLDEIAGWRIREPASQEGVELTFIADAAATRAPLLSGRVSLPPQSLQRVEPAGLRLQRDPVEVGVFGGSQDTVAMLLVTSEQAFTTISIATAMEGEAVQTHIPVAAVKWIPVVLPKKNVAHTLSISIDALHDERAHLLAICLHPANNRNAWLRFSDQIERGTYPRLKAETRKIAESFLA